LATFTATKGYVYSYDGLRLQLRLATFTATMGYVILKIGYVYSYDGLRLHLR